MPETSSRRQPLVAAGQAVGRLVALSGSALPTSTTIL